MEELRRERESLRQLFILKRGDTIERKGEHEDWSLEWAVDDLTGCELDGNAVKAA
mgnify:FL=1